MAVHTLVQLSQARLFLQSRTNEPILSCRGVPQGVENSNFVLSTPSRRLILTLYEKRADPALLPFHLNLMQYAAQHGVRCPIPLPDKNGRALGTLLGKPAAAFSFLHGVSPINPSPHQCSMLGRSLAQFHIAVANFPNPPQNPFGPASWNNLAQPLIPLAHTVHPNLPRILSLELDVLPRKWSQSLPHGVVHADLFPDNVLFHPELPPAFIDFYFAAHDALAYDLAVCLNSWCFEPDVSFNITKAAALLQAYHSARPLSPHEIRSIPLLCRGAALRFLLTRLHDVLHPAKSHVGKPKDPLPFLQRLLHHQKTPSLSDCGVSLS